MSDSTELKLGALLADNQSLKNEMHEMRQDLRELQGSVQSLLDLKNKYVGAGIVISIMISSSLAFIGWMINSFFDKVK